ncbi:hypothetical protein GJAV_G00029940 [Gymnothorax javanicus]|nr:hypothetical protein GJAV_G00029940 [Gymnothorax javanicus]
MEAEDVRGQTELVFTHPEPTLVEVAVQSVCLEPTNHHPVLALCGEGLTREEQDRLTALLREWSTMFVAHGENFGWTSAVLHQIPTGDAPPVWERHRPIPPSLYAELRDLFSRYAVAVPTRDQSAVTTAKALWEAFVQTCGYPERFLSDQGGAFESELWPGQPVYSVRPEGKDGPIRTLDRNNLRPCPDGLQESPLPTATEPQVELEVPEPFLPLWWPLWNLRSPVVQEVLEPVASVPAEQTDRAFVCSKYFATTPRREKPKLLSSFLEV